MSLANSIRNRLFRKDRDDVIRDLLCLIEQNDWNKIADYQNAALSIETLATAPIAPDVADKLKQHDEALLCLRRQPAAHYSIIFLRKNPVTGQPYDGSFSAEGLISIEEGNALRALAEDVATPRMRMAEIGCFTGRGSTRYLSEVARANGGSIACIDRFPNDGVADLRDLFEHSTAALGFRDLLKVIQGNSHETASRFPDGYFDLVYIDAGHGFDDVTRDIRAWQPKVRSGGILCGHDCIRKASEFSPDQMKALMQDDSSIPRHLPDPRNPEATVWSHPGVILAVAETVGDGAKVSGSPCGIWSYLLP